MMLFITILTFLPAAALLLISSPPLSAERVLGWYRHVAGDWHDICYPPPPPPHFLDAVTRCKSRTYVTSLNTAYPIDTVGYWAASRRLDVIHPLKLLKQVSIYYHNIYCANYCLAPLCTERGAGDSIKLTVNKVNN